MFTFFTKIYLKRIEVKLTKLVFLNAFAGAVGLRLKINFRSEDEQILQTLFF